ncbi:unnamed protein product [Macrosiphum euphorbiae]|uniref:Uncharacterized protein n=1 Tax=Macrosiphum euphorbiae TaxID=13131 RepID=A0AAV0Y1P3_9HEMI|nr:unnamed protein product [Macrosiphum euphorbiae]
MSDVAKSSSKMLNCFDILQDIFLFFSKSAPRWASLALGDDVAKTVLKKHRYRDVLKSLTNITLTSDKKEEMNRAKGLKKKLESFEFVLILTIWEHILRPFYMVDGDKRQDITEENLRVKVFLPLIDTALVQLNNRFIGLQKVVDKFNFLNPHVILQSSEDNLVKATYDFILYYEKDISSDFTRQMLSLKEARKKNCCK